MEGAHCAPLCRNSKKLIKVITLHKNNVQIQKVGQLNVRITLNSFRCSVCFMSFEFLFID
jgi:hypothetical protein